MGKQREFLRGRILVGESDPRAAEKLTEALAADGHEVCVAEDAAVLQDARVGSAVVGTFDVIVWDMGGGPPPAQVEQRLSDPSVARALILVSGSGRLATAVEAERLGATAILPSPVDPIELCRAVASALHGL
jgi:DNA-binding NtrC family response regulator